MFSQSKGGRRKLLEVCFIRLLEGIGFPPGRFTNRITPNGSLVQRGWGEEGENQCSQVKDPMRDGSYLFGWA